MRIGTSFHESPMSSPSRRASISVPPDEVVGVGMLVQLTALTKSVQEKTLASGTVAAVQCVMKGWFGKEPSGDMKIALEQSLNEGKLSSCGRSGPPCCSSTLRPLVLQCFVSNVQYIYQTTPDQNLHAVVITAGFALCPTHRELITERLVDFLKETCDNADQMSTDFENAVTFEEIKV